MPKPPDPLASRLAAMLEPTWHTALRPMFGAVGVYCDGVMVGCVMQDAVYLRTDPRSAAPLIARGWEQFEYRRGGRTVRLPFYAVPKAVLSDPEALRDWVAEAREAGLRLAAARKPRRSRRAPPR